MTKLTGSTRYGGFGAKLVDVEYLAALETLVDASTKLASSGLRTLDVSTWEAALARVSELEASQDRYRSDAEIGPRSLKRFERNGNFEVFEVKEAPTKPRQGRVETPASARARRSRSTSSKRASP